MPAPRDADGSRAGVLRTAAAHPLVVTAALVAVVAVGHAVWIATHRTVGTFDPDEAGYLGTALRFHRSLRITNPFAFVRQVGSTANGPLVPVLSVPLLVIGGTSTTVAFLVQPVLLVVTSVAIAGICRRMAGPGAAVAAGVVVALLPTVVSATDAYWLGLGAAACMAVAMWALAASERCTNRLVYVVGAATAAMLLARTMTLGYVPAVAVAGLVTAGRRRAGLVGLTKAGVVTAVIAGPWYVAQRHAIFDYLFSFGYGKRAARFGPTGPMDRIRLRADRYLEGVGAPVLWSTLAVVALWGAWWLWRHRAGPRAALPPWIRTWAALAAAIGVGTLALVSSANNGVWFELPLVVLLVPLAMALVASAPWPARIGLALVVAAQAVVVVGTTWWLIDPIEGQPTHAVYEDGFAQYDVRFGHDHRSEVSDAAADWWGLARRVDRRLRAIDGADGDRTLVNITGNMELFNGNDLLLNAELDGWGLDVWSPDTTLSPSERARELTATTDGRRRVLVVAVHNHIPFTPDTEVRSYLAQARSLGWRTSDRFEMPRTRAIDPDTNRPVDRHGYVLILTRR